MQTPTVTPIPRTGIGPARPTMPRTNDIAHHSWNGSRGFLPTGNGRKRQIRPVS